MAKLGLVAAMEQEAAIEEAIEQENEIEIPQAVDSLETQMLEVQETVKEIEDRVEQIEDAVEDVETLEKVEEKIEQEAEEGGMTEATAEMAEIAVESLYRRLGMGRSVRPSMESFGNTSTRMDATKIALEGVRDGIKRAWQAIVDAIKRAIDWVVNFFRSVFGANERMAKRADKIVEAAPKATGETFQEKIKVRGLANNLAMGGKFDRSQILKGVEAAQKEADKMVEEMTSMQLVMDTIEISPEGKVNNVSKLSDVLGKLSSEVKDSKSEELPGNRCIERKTKTLNIFGKEVKTWHTITVVPFNERMEKLDEAEIKPMNEQGIKSIGEAVRKLAQRGIANKRLGEQVTKSMKKLMGEMDKVVKSIEKQPGAVPTELQNLRNFVPGQVTYVTKLSNVLGSVNLKIGKSALDYCEVCLNNYKDNQGAIRKILGKAGDKASQAGGYVADKASEVGKKVVNVT